MTASTREEYLDLLGWMVGRTRLGMKPGLETTRELLARLGHPERGMRAIQIAGTNGKGSTSRLLQTILASQGLRVGLFTSPHLVCVRERFVIGDEAMPEAEFVRLVRGLRPAAEATGATFFELCTVLAVLWFAARKVDVAVMETGLGGRFDSVTALPAEGLVLTGVDLDHVQILGDTVEKIWIEKIAAMRPGRPVFTRETRPELRGILSHEAASRGCPVVECLEDAPLAPPLEGMHQAGNLALAWNAARSLLGREPLSGPVESAFAAMCWPGRAQRVAGDPEVRLDVGHNPQAIAALAAAFGKQPFVLLFGCMADKDWQAVLALLSPGALGVHYLPLDTPRAARPEALAAVFAGEAHGTVASAWAAAAAQAREAGVPLVVCGSFHTVGAAMRCLHEEGRLEFWPQGIVPDPEVPGLG
jgi:dihydrofolate synthase/folylpolyglutamate synthase